MCVLSSSCCSFWCFFVLVIFVVFVLSFTDLWLFSLMYGVNECNVPDECMFFLNQSPTMMCLAEGKKRGKKEKKEEEGIFVLDPVRFLRRVGLHSRHGCVSDGVSSFTCMTSFCVPP